MTADVTVKHPVAGVEGVEHDLHPLARTDERRVLPPRPRRKKLPLALFLMTCVSTFWVGATRWRPEHYLGDVLQPQQIPLLPLLQWLTARIERRHAKREVLDGLDAPLGTLSLDTRSGASMRLGESTSDNTPSTR